MATLTLDVFHHNNIANRMASIIEYLQFSFFMHDQLAESVLDACSRLEEANS